MIDTIMFVIGLLIMAVTVWAAQYFGYHRTEWYTIPAIFTIWIIRAIAVVMMILPFLKNVK